MDQPVSQRGKWGSKFGFILAAAGSAIGLGNIWRFPTVTGENGGAAFVIVYLVCVLLIGVPIMLAEFAIGRRARSDPMGAFHKLAPGTPWRFVGALGVLTGLIILSYYSVVAGWTLKYVILTLTGALQGADPDAIRATFTDFIQSGQSVTSYHLLFMVLTVWIVTGGIQGGIERAAKVLMPLLLLLLLLLVLRSVTLPGAREGLLFYLKPDFGKITFSVVLAALGQAFFSLSLGMGAMITYGSYISEDEDLVSSAVSVSCFDSLIAILAGFAIFPALFSVPGLSPDAGPGLIFVVLPNIFNAIPLGHVFGALFFVLLAIAALTSSISLLEVTVAYAIDQLHWTRTKAALVMGLLVFVFGVPSALSNGAVPAFSGVLDVVDRYFGNISLVLGALLLSLFVGWKWGITDALAEIGQGRPRFIMAATWGFLIRYACPIAIVTILVNILIG